MYSFQISRPAGQRHLRFKVVNLGILSSHAPVTQGRAPQPDKRLKSFQLKLIQLSHPAGQRQLRFKIVNLGILSSLAPVTQGRAPQPDKRFKGLHLQLIQQELKQMQFCSSAGQREGHLNQIRASKACTFN